MIVTLLIVLAEVTAALLIILGIVAWKALAARRRDRAAMTALVTSINTSQDARVEKLTDRFKSDGKLSDEDALAKANDLIKMQNRFYQDVVDLYFSRNNEVLSNLDQRLESLMEHYGAAVAAAATGSTDAAQAASAAAIERLSQEMAALTQNIEELRSQNSVLHDQLKSAEHELDQLGREYTSAFNRNREVEGAAVPAPDVTDQAPSSFNEEAVPAAAEAGLPLRTAPERGLLEDLDLSELIGKDAGPPLSEAVKKQA